MALDTNLPVFARPIEIHSANKTFEITANASAESLSLTEGTYANLAALLVEFEYQMEQHTELAASTAELNSDLKVYLHESTNFSVSWTHTALRDLLGFDDDLLLNRSHTADYMSPYLWHPTYLCANQGEWYNDPGASFSGTVSQSGRVAGSRTAPRYYMRTFDFVFEPIARVYSAAGASAYEQDNSFESFYEATINAYPVSDTVTLKGFYFFPTVQDLLDNETTTDYDGGGINFEYDSSPDTYVYCSPSLKFPSITPAIPSGKLYYDITGFEVRTATAPTWATPNT